MGEIQGITHMDFFLSDAFTFEDSFLISNFIE